MFIDETLKLQQLAKSIINNSDITKDEILFTTQERCEKYPELCKDFLNNNKKGLIIIYNSRYPERL